MFFMTLAGIEKKQERLDDHLMERVASGDMDAFGKLYELSKHAVYCLLLSIVRDHDSAEDLMQDTYLSVRKSIKNYVPQNKPLAWIFTIAKNLAYMKMRRAGWETADDFSQYDVPDNNDNLEQVTNRMVLNSAMKVLKSQERQIVLLHAVTGMKFREIAKCLDLAVGTVLSSYTRSLKKLRKSIEEEGCRDE